MQDRVVVVFVFVLVVVVVVVVSAVVFVVFVVLWSSCSYSVNSKQKDCVPLLKGKARENTSAAKSLMTAHDSSTP